MDVLSIVLAESGLTLWTFVGETKDGVIPVGMAAGWTVGRVVSVSKMIAFPWASNRNIIESVANGFNTMRKRVFDEFLDIDDPNRYFLVLSFTEFRDKKFYEKIEDMKIIRKVGHVFDMQPDGTSILFQTRTPVKDR